MGGHIYLESEGLGKGSTAVFVVKLGVPEPSSDSRLPFANIIPPSQGQINFPGLKVLIMAENGLVNLFQSHLNVVSSYIFCWFSG